MNRQMLIGTIIGAVAVTAIGGVASYRILDGEYADVLSVQPIAAMREECRDQMVSRQKPVKDPHQVAGTVAGAVIGGVLGSKVGGGSGKDIATVGGAVAGGYAGNKIQENIQENNVELHTQRVCEQVTDLRAPPDGYHVTYLYEGVERTVMMDNDPGSRIRMEEGMPATNR